MGHDTPVFIGISELVLRALVLDQQNHCAASQGQMPLDNADIGLIYGSVIIRFVALARFIQEKLHNERYIHKNGYS